MLQLTNRFHVAVGLFSNRPQMTSTHGKNKVAQKPRANGNGKTTALFLTAWLIENLFSLGFSRHKLYFSSLLHLFPFALLVYSPSSAKCSSMPSPTQSRIIVKTFSKLLVSRSDEHAMTKSSKSLVLSQMTPSLALPEIKKTSFRDDPCVCSPIDHGQRPITAHVIFTTLNNGGWKHFRTLWCNSNSSSRWCFTPPSSLLFLLTTFWETHLVLNLWW